MTRHLLTRDADRLHQHLADVDLGHLLRPPAQPADTELYMRLDQAMPHRARPGQLDLNLSAGQGASARTPRPPKAPARAASGTAAAAGAGPAAATELAEAEAAYEQALTHPRGDGLDTAGARLRHLYAKGHR